MIKKTKLAILISGNGSNMKALINDMVDKEYAAEPVLVISDKPNAPALMFAKNKNIKTAVVNFENSPSRTIFESKLANLITLSGSEIICLAGFMRILSPRFISLFKDSILNIHPSILPLFKGLNTHQRAINSGMTLHGATVHLVTSQLDEGKILGQGVVPILKHDTSISLAARVLALEHQLYPTVVRKFVRGDTDPVLLWSD